MTYDEFWFGDFNRFERMIHAYNVTRKKDMEHDMQNQDILAWRIGAYVSEAVDSSVGNMFRKGQKAKYPSKPHALKEESSNDDDQQMMKDYANMMAWSQAFNATLKK